MALTPEIKGGETVDVLRDVTLARRVINPKTAWHASRTAMRYAFEADFLPFTKTIYENNTSSRIVRVGAYSPVNYTNTKGTIIANPKEVGRSKSFVLALKALHRAVGADFTESSYAQVMVNLDDTRLGVHADYGTYERSFIQLEGMRIIDLIDTDTEEIDKKLATIVLTPGDVYSMRFREEAEPPILHGVTYMGEPYSVGVYIDHPIE